MTSTCTAFTARGKGPRRSFGPGAMARQVAVIGRDMSPIVIVHGYMGVQLHIHRHRYTVHALSQHTVITTINHKPVPGHYQERDMSGLSGTPDGVTSGSGLSVSPNT